jgi:hypothetical protein
MKKNILNRINYLGWKIGLSHYVWHCFIASLFFSFGLIISNPVAGWLSGIIFYWSREISQFEVRNAHHVYLKQLGVYQQEPKFELWDALYPTISNTALLLLYFVITMLILN